jgi:lipopolysaccharide assembly outer membrane protein LptD (OstA)
MSLLPIARIFGLILVVCGAFTSGAVAQQPESEQAPAENPEPETSRSRAETKLPKDLDVTFGNMRLTESGEYVFTERVTLTWKESRIQADRVLVRPGEYVEAEGNVLIVWGGNRLFGNRLTYDLQEERGFVEDAVGEVNDEYIFWAKRAEKIGDDVIRVEKGVVTTCTQPVPWSTTTPACTTSGPGR